MNEKSIRDILEVRKNDSDKDPWHLAPWDAFQAIVEILRYGVEKYTSTATLSEREAPQWWINYLMADPQAPVTRIVLDMSETVVVEGATNAIYETPTQNSLNDSGKIAGDGASVTQNVLPLTQSGAAQTRSHDAETLQPIVQQNYATTAPMRRNYKRYVGSKTTNVRSVNDPCQKLGRSMSITATTLEGHAVSFVVDATTVSECLRIASGCLARRFATWSAPRSLSFDTCGTTLKITIDGSRNWEKGMPWSRMKSALDRHMVAWWQGENLDPETGKSHLWHAGCCIVFLIAYEIRGIGTDDRPFDSGQKYLDHFTSKELVEASMDVATRTYVAERIVPRHPKLEEHPPWLRRAISIPITIADRWYSRVDSDLYALDSWVYHEGDGDEPPPELRGFYTYQNPPGAEGWLLEIAICPPDIRENYYSKYVYRDKLTSAEFKELLSWERGLYELKDDRYQLKSTMQAWGRG